MLKPKVGFGICTYGHQPPQFWLPYTQTVVSLEKFGIEYDRTYWSGTSFLDVNRNIVADMWYKENKSEWLFWVDGDNPPSPVALRALLDLERPLVSGIYYGGSAENGYTPISYVRNAETGLYVPLNDLGWEKGEILQVDVGGMGCFLTHRDVYRDILEEYEVYQRNSGGSLVIRNDQVDGEVPEAATNHPYAGQVKKGLYYEPVVQADKTKEFPFFMKEFLKSEDMHFCKLARDIGYEIWVDTSIEVGHLKEWSITGKEFRDVDRPDSTPRELNLDGA